MSESGGFRFAVFVLLSLVVFMTLLKAVLRRRQVQPSALWLAWVSGVGVGAGMTFGRLGAHSGLPVWIYYGLPAVTTLLLPPLAFRMRIREAGVYVCGASLLAPVIHVGFSFILGWKEYFPFWTIPSWRELLS